MKIQSELSHRIMAFAENINERVKGQESAAAAQPAKEAEPRQPRPLMEGKHRPPTPITDDIRRQVHDLRASGLSRDAIADELKIGGSTVSRILDAPPGRRGERDNALILARGPWEAGIAGAVA